MYIYQTLPLQNKLSAVKSEKVEDNIDSEVSQNNINEVEKNDCQEQ